MREQDIDGNALIDAKRWSEKRFRDQVEHYRKLGFGDRPDPQRHDRVARDDRSDRVALGDANAARSTQQTKGDEAMSTKKAKKLRQLYGGRKPKSYRPAHNHVIHTPGFAHSVNGFRRFWIPPQWVGRGWAKCPCGWMSHRPEWKTHYAHSVHVRWWKSEIKKRGSLEAVHRHVIERLAADDHQRGIKHSIWDNAPEQMSRGNRATPMGAA